MKKKRFILSLLLSAFMFVAFHDFVIEYYDPDTQIELSLTQSYSEAQCDMSNIHENIHYTMMFYTQNTHLFSTSPIDFSPYFSKDSQPFQTFQQSIYRPPIV